MRALHSSAFVVVPNRRDKLAKKRTVHGKIVVAHIIVQAHAERQKVNSGL